MATPSDPRSINLQALIRGKIDRRDFMRLAAGVGAGAGLLATCERPGSALAARQSAPTAGGVLQLGITDIATLNPFVSNTVVENYVLMMLYPTLATLDEASNRVPYLSEGWETSPDGLTHTIKIRQGFLWDDGQPLTARDVKFTADFEKANKFSWKAGIVDAVASMETPDDYTVVVKMSEPVGTFLLDFTFWYRIMPQHIWEPLPDPKTFANEQPVGAGPFKFARWEKAQFIELDARKDYSFPPTEHPPYLDKLVYRIYPDINTLVLAFQNGDIGAVPSGLPVDSVDAVKASPEFAVIRNPSTGYNHISYNVAGNPYLADVKVRQALAMGVDKETILGFLLKGYGGAMTTITSPVLTEWYNPEVADWPFDLDAANKLLDEAGYTDTDGNGKRNAPADRGGADVAFRLSYASNDPTYQKLAPILKENWEKLGITINLDAQESNALYQRVRFDHDFDLWISGWGITDNPPFNYYNFLHSSQYTPGSNNFIGLKDQAFDDLILATYREPDLEKAKEGVKQLQMMEHELVPLIALYYPEFNLAYNRQRWEGFQVLPGSLLGIASWQSMVNVHQREG